MSECMYTVVTPDGSRFNLKEFDDAESTADLSRETPDDKAYVYNSNGELVYETN